MWKWEAEGQAKAVVGLIHSAYEHHERYAWLIQQLRSNQCHVITGNLPGHGIEGHVHNEAIGTYNLYIKRLIAACHAEELPLFLIGHGFGATLLIRLLQKENIECAGVILTSPWLELTHQPPKLLTMLMKISPSAKIDHAINSTLLTRGDLHQRQFEEDPLYHCVVTSSWYHDAQLLMKTIEQTERKYQDISTLVFVGAEDAIANPIYTQQWFYERQLSHLQFKKWPLARHDVRQEEEREEMLAYANDFINNVLRSLGYIV